MCYNTATMAVLVFDAEEPPARVGKGDYNSGDGYVPPFVSIPAGCNRVINPTGMMSGAARLAKSPEPACIAFLVWGPAHRLARPMLIRTPMALVIRPRGPVNGAG